MKKVLLLLAILLALGLTAGCAGGSEADDVPADDLITDDSAEEPAGIDYPVPELKPYKELWSYLITETR